MMSVSERSSVCAALLFASLTFVLHLAANPHYGFFRDELYFIVCGRHPDFGYVDQPPLVPLLAAASQGFGISLVALRAVSALWAAIAVCAACRLADEAGGGAFARLLTAIATGFAPVLAAFGTIFVTDSPLPACWTLTILFAARALDRDPRWWLAAGLALGAGTETKYSTLFVAAALLAGVMFRPQCFRSRWFWAGGAGAAGIAAPSVAWQLAHGLPMLELLRNGQAGKNVMVGPGGFMLQQLLLLGPVFAPVWMAGFGSSLWQAKWRWLGIAALVLFALMIALHGKPYYPSAIYPSLFAMGAVAVEGALMRFPRARWAVPALALGAGAVLVPVVMPVLPEAVLSGYLVRLGLNATSYEHHRPAALGQSFADMHGWQELADTVDALRRNLPPDTRVFARNYGEAAAIDLLTHGPHPRTLSGHNQYWLWGPGDWTGAVTLVVGGDMNDAHRDCKEASQAGMFSAPWIMPYEDALPILLCRGLKRPIQDIWLSSKHFE